MKLFRPVACSLFLFFSAPMALASGTEDEFSPGQLDFFENKVRPLLAEKCYKCHSSGRKKPKAGLYLDTRAGVLKGGESGPALVPGDLARSRLVQAVRYENPDLQMPPKKKLSPEEISVLERWVGMGAPDPRGGGRAVSAETEFDLEKRRSEHWAWQAVRPVEAPGVKDRSWPRGDLDRFILVALEKMGLEPNPDASKRSMIKRVSYALTGLPPGPEEVERFLADDSPGAFAALVDRLLESPHYGEHWAQHWLDLVRFAETKGHEADYPIPEAWRYRDYVIRGFNGDVPYDRWILEHIAGDLVESPRIDPGLKTNESIQGTGFWHLGEATHSPVDIRGEEADRVHNQIDVFSKTFLGLSLGCARCHDHKFDPISQADYYAMYGYIQSSGLQLADVLDPEKKKEAASALEALRRREGKKVLDSFARLKRAQLERLPGYLTAAAEVLRLGPLEAKPAGDSSDILFEDFEKLGYIGWTVKGLAFGEGPRTQANLPGNQGDVGARGKGFVNSHSYTIRGKVHIGDKFVGSMLSSRFKIERRFINLLVGGGAHKGATCVDLIIDGKPVASVLGPNNNRMVARSIDVSGWIGDKAQIRILDNEKGGWGNIGADHIVFSDRAVTGPAVAGNNAELAERIADVAGKRKLHQGVLRRVVAHVERAKKDGNDPLHAFARLSELEDAAEAAKTREEIESRLRQAAGSYRQRLDARKVIKHVKDGERNYSKVERPWSKATDLVVDYGDPGPEDWIVSGHRYGSRPLAEGELLIGDEGRPVREFVEEGRADAEELSRRFYGFLRTPTFEVVGDSLWYRVRGSCDVFLAVDSHRTVYGPLHGVVKKRIKGDAKTWRWHSHRVRDYLGHRIHIEFSNVSENFAVARVEFNAGTPLESSPVNSVVLAHVAGLKEAGSADAGAAFARLLVDSLEVLAGADAAGQDLSDHARLLNWVIAREDMLEPQPLDSLRDIVKNYRVAKAELEKTIPGTLKALALLDGSGEDEPLHIRGNHKNRSRELVPRAILTALKTPGDKGIAVKKGSGRLALARRLVSRRNPLVARVMVNRIWHHLFGRGIVESCDDFGVMGMPPTHPELLDRLALQFMDNGWSVKKLIRSILLSRTYGMSSSPQERGSELDPENKLLHRMPILRLEAEAIRDKVLAVSGRLDRRLYGKGVMVHITEFMRGNRSPGGSGPIDGNGRRSIYTEVRRNHLPSMLLAFDRPIPFMTMGKRVLSNSPAQALIMLNDPFIHQQVGIWSKRLLARQGKSDEELLQQAYHEAFQRPARAEEIAVAVEFLASQARLYDKVPRQRAWDDLLHTLMNVKEFIFIN